MLGLFRSNQLATNFLLIIYVVVLRLSIFLFPEEWTPNGSGILSYHVYEAIGSNGWLPNLLALLLVFLQAFLINVLASRFRLSKEVTMYAGVFYILLASTMPGFLHLSPVLLGNTFLILAIMNLFQTYRRSSSAGAIFNTGLWIGVASLFYFSNIVFVLFAIIGLSILRALRFNEILMIIIGAFVPYFFAGTFAFMGDSLSAFHHLQIEDNIGFLSFDWKNVWENHATLGIFGFLSIVALLSFNIYFQKQSIQTQKYIQTLYSFFLVFVLTIFTQYGIRPDHLLLLTIPLSLLLPLNFLNFRNQNLTSTLHIVWLILVLAIQYKILWIDKV